MVFIASSNRRITTQMSRALEQGCAITADTYISPEK